ncbi:hypothetical protein RRV45_14255 [Bacillus sp. DTU_2020_1000418_1_SI_GHA_SEK_038]|uniref:hypothetical protein n=1 Tax=Bacillus sp. DTU_2020_1000418_1_SI_GHA_SEK_038 TaxID=3077585 RepID=UPI0028E4C1A1|nr:hypothetical protein [Bacillus sp. DTU_2020_1000418_1_SI_GHA_SEK_038]WNS74078.1 hypothetical protein RRV45_14255 [Bacillus sp. DTU_2020_1000418_1_SI_GHA_SEK_038]
MKKSEWTEEQLEELLGKMPRIKDERDPREIYHHVAIKMQKRKQKMWIMPSIATAGAFLLFFILVPNLFNWQSFSENSMETADKSSSASEIMMEKKSLEENKDQLAVTEENGASIEMAREKEEKQMGITSIEVADETTAVYEEDIIDKEVLTYAVPNHDVSFIVPISLIVPKDDQKSKFDLFLENMPNLAEVKWGLTDYYPLQADLNFDEENQIMTFNVPANHSYGMSSNTEWLLGQVMNYIMDSFDIKKVNLTTEGNPGIGFSHLGKIDEFVTKEQSSDDAYYFYFPSDVETKPFIVPYKFTEKQGTIQEAFSIMRNNQAGEKLIASIPDTIQFETEENPKEGKLIIKFEKGSQLNNDEETLHTIEAILLTAKEFNYEFVKLENANIDRIGIFDLNQEIKVPVSANKRTISN